MSAEELFYENQKLVYWVINNKFNTLRVEKEDVIQNGMIGLWKACLNFSADRGKFSTYAVTNIKNEILIGLRKIRYKKQAMTVCFADLDEYVLENLSSSDDVFDIDESSLYLKLLNSKEQELVNYLIQDKNQKEIACDIGISQSEVSRRIGRLRRKLRAIMEVGREL